MTDQNVLLEIDRTLKRLYQTLDKLGREDFEFDESDGKLTIEFEEGTKVIVSRQSATAQLWLAEPNGGWKFNLKEGHWIDDKRQITLNQVLSELISVKLGEKIEIE
jgi:CyaY protein